MTTQDPRNPLDESMDSLLEMRTLANQLIDKGETERAIELYLKKLEICEQTRGQAETRDSLESFSKAGNHCRLNGDLVGAYQLFQRGLAESTRLLGPKAPGTLTCEHDLADLISARGDFVRAEALCRKVVQARKQILGADDPATLESRSTLAHILQGKGDYSGAETIFRKLLKASESAHGPEHPNTLECVNCLASLLKAKGETDWAEVIYRRVLAATEFAQGPGHRDSLLCQYRIADVLQANGNLTGAEAIFRKVVKVSDRTLDRGDSLTLRTMCRLALLLQVKGDTAEAAATYLRMLQMSLDGFGPEESSENLRSLNRLLNSQSDIAAAEAIYRKILKASDIAFGPEDSITLRCLNNLAILLSSTGRPSEAVDIFRSYTVKSNAAARAVKYDLACYECLAGNVADAKRLILECLGHDPDLKFQLRNDPDFLQIREFIQTL